MIDKNDNSLVEDIKLSVIKSQMDLFHVWYNKLSHRKKVMRSVYPFGLDNSWRKY